jgi:DNA-directed RNA polymerase subunit RPC12/RpoP
VFVHLISQEDFMINTNCLAKIRCPHCGNDHHFHISAGVLAYVTDDGAEAANNGSIEWDEDSAIECPECGHSGTVGRFTTTESEEE